MTQRTSNALTAVSGFCGHHIEPIMTDVGEILDPAKIDRHAAQVNDVCDELDALAEAAMNREARATEYAALYKKLAHLTSHPSEDLNAEAEAAFAEAGSDRHRG